MQRRASVRSRKVAISLGEYLRQAVPIKAPREPLLSAKRLRNAKLMTLPFGSYPMDAIIASFVREHLGTKEKVDSLLTQLAFVAKEPRYTIAARYYSLLNMGAIPSIKSSKKGRLLSSQASLQAQRTGESLLTGRRARIAKWAHEARKSRFWPLANLELVKEYAKRIGSTNARTKREMAEIRRVVAVRTEGKKFGVGALRAKARALLRRTRK
jgi:hypothetical protein